MSAKLRFDLAELKKNVFSLLIKRKNTLEENSTNVVKLQYSQMWNSTGKKMIMGKSDEDQLH